MWVAIALTSLAVILVLVLCVPLTITLHTRIYGRPELVLQISWFFGILNKELSGTRKEPGDKKKPSGGRRMAEWRRLGTIYKILRIKGLLKQCRTLVWDVLASLSVSKLAIDLKLGLGNPADTGLLFAVLGPAIPFVKFPFPHEIRLQPAFSDEMVFQGFSQGKIRVLPIQLVPPVFKFAFSLPSLRALKGLVLSQWRKEK